MKILVKNDFISNTLSVLHIFHIDDEDYIEKWINEYIQTQISHQVIDSNISYKVESDFTEFSLIQKHNILNKGYLYNTNSLNYIKLFSINITSYNDNDSKDNVNISLQENQPYTKMYNDINQEINKRIIKELSKDTLILLQNEYNQKIQTKSNWTQKELILLQNNIIKNNEIKLFNTFSKQLKKNNKKQKRNNLETPKINLLLQSCKEEYLNINHSI